MTRRTLVAAATAALLACAVAPVSAAAPTPAPGGSNYAFYQLDGCNREPYGVIDRFTQGRSTIVAQLAAMRKAGQQRLRIPIFHYRGADDGTLMNSTGGNLSPQNRQNLRDLLAAVRSAGFTEVDLGFFPIGLNAPYNWSTFDEGMYQENWNLIYNLHPVIAGAGIPYRIDLMNEGLPTPSQTALRDYDKRLWADYTHTFGKNDTLGFSIIGDPNRIGQLDAVYQDNPPYLFDVHFYGNEYNAFVDAHKKMESMGYHQGWILGEGYYNDASAAADFHRARTDTGRQIYYMTQWPLTRAQKCADVDTAPPKDFSAYTAQGFWSTPGSPIRPGALTETSGSTSDQRARWCSTTSACGEPVIHLSCIERDSGANVHCGLNQPTTVLRWCSAVDALPDPGRH